MGESTAWWISNRSRPHFELDDATSPTSNSSNVTYMGVVNASTSIFSHPLVRAVSSDIVSGQIIASLIVLVFVAIFLLREWISQNARPGVFEEVDAPGAVEFGQPQDPPAVLQIAQQQPAPVPVPAILAPPANGHGPAAAVPHVPAVWDRPRRNNSDRNDIEEPLRDGPNKRIRHTAPQENRAPRERKGLRKDKGKRVARRERSPTSELRQRHRWSSPGKTTSSINGGSETDNEDHQAKQKLVMEWRSKNAEGWREIRNLTSQPLNLDPEQTQFTFTALSPRGDEFEISGPDSVYNLGTTSSRPRSTNPDVPEDITSLTSPTDEQSAEVISSASLPGPSNEHEQADIPEEAGVPGSESQSPMTDAEKDKSDVVDAEMTLSLSSSSLPADNVGNLRRPPLPTVTLSPSSVTTPPASTPRSGGSPPLASPNLATYKPPEEFEAGPSNLTDYFDDEDRRRNEKDPDTELRKFFVDLDEDIDDDDDELDVDPDADAASGYNHWSDVEIRELDEDGPNPPPAVMPQEQPLDQEGLDRQALDRILDREVARLAANGDVRLPEPVEEMDGNLEDDMDGALEAIGLRGPVHGVLQNAALMIFILDTTIGLGVWLPFTIGKSTALLSLDPKRFLQILHLPLRMIRLITDPIVDSVALVINQYLLPRAMQIGMSIFGLLIRTISQERARQFIVLGANLYGQASIVMDYVWEQAVARNSAKPSATSSRSFYLTFVEELMEADGPVMSFIDPSFAPLGSTIRLTAREAKRTWISLAVGNGPNEKVFAILLGYAVVGLLLAIYLNVLTVGNVRSAGRAVRSAIRQQLLVIKVAIFIVIELVIFPLGCGVMLDACSVWLLPQSNFRTRAAFLVYAPVSSVFYHWVIGTMFMYQFAVLLAGCREIMRPGSMWFIKDPQDQNFHPIRDILERPTLVQLRKLFLSAIMYGLVVAAGVGTVSGVLQFFSKTILPFRWKVREPLSVVPVDLLFLHLVLPYTMQYFRPKKALRQFGVRVWKYLAAQLRLTSYMFGGRHLAEECTPKHWSWKTLLGKQAVAMDDVEAVHDGAFRRVPNSDNVALVKDSPATAEVDQEGKPLNDEQAKLIAAQNSEADKAKRSIKDDYVIVYLPPRLKYRIAAFIVAIWVIGSVMFAAALGAPIMLGRKFFELFVQHEVHDGYSFIAGFYLLWACLLVGHSIDRMDKRRQRRGGDEPRAEWPLYLAKRCFLWIAQMAYLTLLLGFVIPTLVALVMEFYVVRPVRQIFDPPDDFRIRIVDMWAFGLLYCKIMIRCLRMQPGNDFIQGIDHILRQGWTHPDPFRATREVIAPITFGLLGMLLLPAGFLWAVRRAVSFPIGDDFLFVHLYPSIFTVAGFSHAVVVLSKGLASWSQTIRDKEFLVEMRLQNHELVSEAGQPKNIEIQVKEEEEEEE
ncbi:uncharacterized protein FIBRA_04697 [Fibroporia radiculosa]|uniref:RING-type E3 ubiquitin transferase n=1 Tax=Fibroporia radiculosa TaxID=599839 RepID=J4H337_9APHY|nr:uncharacterized protein FIBRA_04697 [Fibroporia radiculosa]CCM02594.1 predicted protein [Fibroporia radiculosa]